MPIKTVSGYLIDGFYHDPTDLIERVQRDVPLDSIDTFVGIGLSGALVVPLLGREFKKYFALVRKNGVRSHSTYPVEGELGEHYALIDDQVFSGRTRRFVVKAVAEHVERYGFSEPTTYMGTYAYHKNDHMWLPAKGDEYYGIEQEK